MLVGRAEHAPCKGTGRTFLSGAGVSPVGMCGRLPGRAGACGLSQRPSVIDGVVVAPPAAALAAGVGSHCSFSVGVRRG